MDWVEGTLAVRPERLQWGVHLGAPNFSPAKTPSLGPFTSSAIRGGRKTRTKDLWGFGSSEVILSFFGGRTPIYRSPSRNCTITQRLREPEWRPPNTHLVP